MSHRLLSIIVCAGLLLCPGIELHAQDSLRIVILSDRVGQEIDLAEREQFHIFSPIDGFRKATVLRSADGKFYVRFELLGPDNTVTEKISAYPEAVLLNLAEKINHFEGMSDGTYVWGSDRTSLKVVGGETFTWKDLAGKVRPVTGGFVPPPDLLPFWRNQPPERAESFPQLSARVGISTSSVDLGEINTLITSIEDYYRAQGYYINPTPAELALNPQVWFCLGLDLSSTLSLTVETGKATGDNIDVKTVAASVVYRPSFPGPGVFRPFVGAGIISTSLLIGQLYKHSETISPVDSTDGYYYLAGIGVKGNNRTTGAMVTVGFELYEPAFTLFGVQAFARYNFLPPITVTSSFGETGEIPLKGLIFGASLAIHF